FNFQMPVCVFSCLPAACSSFKVTFLYQERLVDFFNGLCFFAYGCSNGGESDRTTLEFFDNGTQNPVVHIIQTIFIYIKRLEGHLGNGFFMVPSPFICAKSLVRR